MEPIPSELADLDSLSRQLIQCAKCYQTVVTMFFLPLPLNKTLETLDQVKHCGDTALPDPELYINVNCVKAAIQKLKENNDVTE